MSTQGWGSRLRAGAFGAFTSPVLSGCCMGMMGMMGMAEMDSSAWDQAQPSHSEAELVQVVGDLTVTLTTSPSPPKRGDNKVAVTIRAGNEPVTDASVMLLPTMLGMGMEEKALHVTHTGGGVYEAHADFSIVGAWAIDVRITRPHAETMKARFTVRVGRPAASMMP